MNDFYLVIDYFFEVLTDVFNLIMSNWLFTLSLLILIFSIIVNLMLTIKGK